MTKLIPKKKSEITVGRETLLNKMKEFANNVNNKMQLNIQQMNENTPDRRKVNSERLNPENKNRPTLNLKTRIRGSKVAKNGIKLLKRI